MRRGEPRRLRAGRPPPKGRAEGSAPRCSEPERGMITTRLHNSCGRSNLRWYVGLIVAAMVTVPVCGCGGSERNVPDRAQSREPGAKLAPEADSGAQVHAELKKIAGKWTGLSMSVDGISSPVTEWYRYSFEGDRMTTETSEAGPMAVKFHLDPKTNPQTLDTSMVVAGVEEISKGIYSIDGDILRLSWRVAGERPADFTSRDGDQKIVLVLRRAVE